MIGERYTLILRHEVAVPETEETLQLEPPLTICCTMFDPCEEGEVRYMVNNMLHQMEHEILNRMDGGADDE